MTGDLQSIHIDPALAVSGPFGTTVAHGLLTLSLIPAAMYEALPVEGTIVNYGFNRVRFPAPVPAVSRVRVAFRVESVDRSRAAPKPWSRRRSSRGRREPACVAGLVLRCLALAGGPAQRHLTAAPVKARPSGPSRNADRSATSAGSIRRFTAWGAMITSSSTRSARNAVGAGLIVDLRLHERRADESRGRRRSQDPEFRALQRQRLHEPLTPCFAEM